jgi:hypothetical protein
MNIKRIVVPIVSLTLFLIVAGVGVWVMTAPQDAGPVEAKKCTEYVEELDMLNRYKFFWTFIQRRLAYNNCLDRKNQQQSLPPASN